VRVNCVPGDDEAHGSTEEDVGRKMTVSRDPRKADGSGQAICDEWDPATAAVRVGDDRGDGHSRHGVHGIETARVKWIMSAVEETVGVRSVRVYRGSQW